MSVQGENKSAPSQDFTRQGRAALRVAGRKTGQNRWARALYRGGSATVASVGHVVHALWLEVTGFLFIVLGVIGGGATAREYHRYAAGTTTRGRVILAALFTLLFLYFGANSFWQSRRKTNRG
jgi:hypothetical protein